MEPAGIDSHLTQRSLKESKVKEVSSPVPSLFLLLLLLLFLAREKRLFKKHSEFSGTIYSVVHTAFGFYYECAVCCHVVNKENSSCKRCIRVGNIHKNSCHVVFVLVHLTLPL